MEVMRYQGKDSPVKTLWVTNALSWESSRDSRRRPWAPRGGTGGPAWAVFRAEDIVLNADLGTSINARGQ